MSLLTELFGEEILSASLDEVKAKIMSLPPVQQERKTYLLHDWAAIKGYTLTQKDFEDIKVYNNV
jgi:hypothetical protein